MSISEEQLAKLKAENPGADLSLLECSEFSVSCVVRTPDAREWERYRAEQADKPTQKFQLMRQLLLNHIALPSAADFGPVLTKWPALVEMFCAQVAETAGLGAVVTRRKI